ncbi:MAG: translocation/assembly module TamB [Flavobacteriales bacterium]|nr:translocation/assembly module TamB [Flavobacteriales bacterium]
MIRVLIAMVALLAGAVVALLLPSVQTALAKRLSAKLSAELGTELHIGRVELRLFGPHRLHGVFIADLRGDTLIAADEIWLRGLAVLPKARVVQVRRLELHRSRFALKRDADDPCSNFTNLLNKIAPPSAADTAASAPWTLRCSQVDIRAFHFSFDDGHYAPLPFGVDVNHVDIPSADILGRDLLVVGDSVRFNIDLLAFSDRSGLVVDTMSGRARVSPSGVRVKGLHLVTGPQRRGSAGSDIRGDIELRTESYDDFSDFTSNVFMEGRFDSTRLQFADVALFAPELQGVDLALELGGRVQGRVNGLKGRGVHLRFGTRSEFRGDVEMTGLPDITNTFIVLHAERIATNPADLAALPIPPFTAGGRLEVPDEVKRLGDMVFEGNFTGFINSFTTYGVATTAAGALRSDISYERDTVSGVFDLSGHLASTGFHLGRVLGTTAIGLISADAKVEARGKDPASMEAVIQGMVPQLGLEHYTLNNITINGKLEKNLFNGALQCNDPKALLDFKGLADLRGRWPKVDFSADVHRLDLRALGFMGGTGYSDLQLQVQAQGVLAPDSLQGRVRMQHVSYCQDSVEVDLGAIALDAAREAGVPVVELRSSVADVQVRGTFLPTLLPGALQSTVFSVFPALQEQVQYAQAVQDFEFTATLGRPQPLLDVILPGMQLGPGAEVTGHFDSRNLDLAMDARLPHFTYAGFAADSMRITLGKTMDLLAFSLEGMGRVAKDSIALDGLYITGKAYQDEVGFMARWAAKEAGMSGTVNVNALVQGPGSLSIDLEPSSIDLGQGVWHNDHAAHIQVDSTTITIDSLLLHNGEQHIVLAGSMGKDPTMALAFELLNVRSENLEPLYEGPVVHGFISGDGRLFNLYGDPYLVSYLCVDSLAVEDRPVGDLRFAASFSEESKAIEVNGFLQRGPLRAFDFSGTIMPGKEQELDLLLRMDRFDLRFIDPYMPEAIRDIQGKVTGRIAVSGRLADPQINGYAELEQAGLRIAYLNTYYSFSHRVNILPDMFALDQVRIHDDEGHTALANGTIIHHGLKDWNFDLSMEMDGLKVLDTDANNNELYYGKAYAQGMLGISGYADNLEVNVDAATGEGTDVHFPLGASQEVSGISFVHFTELGKEGGAADQEVDLSGIRLDMKVAVTPQARFELIFDPTVGDIMRGRGSGNIAMTVTPSGDFSMKGDVELVDGDYLFTLRNLVNKRFSVEPGGHITWYGSPFDAILNVDAVYRLRTSLYDVIPAALRTEAYKKRFPVEVHMHLSRNLMNPDVGFDVKLPTVDEGVRTQVRSALATQDDMNKQVFALIVLNRFLPSDATATSGEGSGFGGATAATSTELLSNQLSNWLSSFSSNIDLGVNWRTGDLISQDEVELAVSTAVFNDRLQLNTNLGLAYGSGGTEQGANSLIGDFSAEYSITQDGKLRLKAFSQSNDRNLNQADQALTTQGVGLAYREEFNTLGEFLRKLSRLITGKK